MSRSLSLVQIQRNDWVYIPRSYAMLRLRCGARLQKPNARMGAVYNEMEERGYGIQSTYAQ